MRIEDIWVSQRKLRAPEQIPFMLRTLSEGGVLPPVLLLRAEDGSVQADDGHHRLAALWLSGRRQLAWGDYLLIESDRHRPRFDKLSDLLRRCGLEP